MNKNLIPMIIFLIILLAISLLCACDTAGEEEPEFSPSSPTPYVLCNDKIKSLGFSPKTTLKDGIKRSIRATELRAELRRIK